MTGRAARDGRFARLSFGWAATALLIVVWQAPSDGWIVCGLVAGLLMGPFHAAWLDHREDLRARRAADARLRRAIQTRRHHPEGGQAA